jgi:hypothetical protein
MNAKQLCRPFRFFLIAFLLTWILLWLAVAGINRGWFEFNMLFMGVAGQPSAGRPSGIRAPAPALPTRPFVLLYNEQGVPDRPAAGRLRKTFFLERSGQRW